MSCNTLHSPHWMTLSPFKFSSLLLGQTTLTREHAHWSGLCSGRTHIVTKPSRLDSQLSTRDLPNCTDRNFTSLSASRLLHLNASAAYSFPAPSCGISAASLQSVFPSGSRPRVWYNPTPQHLLLWLFVCCCMLFYFLIFLFCRTCPVFS